MPDDHVSPQELAQLVCAGGDCSRSQAEVLLHISPGSSAQAELLAGAQAIRQQYRGNRLRFCSILNAKAGNCSENCIYCAQARGVETTDYQQHSWLDDVAIRTAADSCREAGAEALSLVAAWRGLKPGPRLDMVCRSIRELADLPLRADASLGLIEELSVAEALCQAGLRMYHHNLETARSFFLRTCTSHTWDQRLRTCRLVKQAGMRLCCGGILGIGEDRSQRAEFAEQLRWVQPDTVPMNFICPIADTPSDRLPPVPTDEALICLAVFRYMLPGSGIVLAGGKEETFGARLHEVLGSGIDGVMVGNYLTTMGTPASYWQTHAPAYGLELCGSTAACS